ncbi:MAG: hypothetical protein RLZZ374_1988 [Cyanobacteriota bacterium]
MGLAVEDWDQPPSLAWPNAPSPPHALKPLGPGRKGKFYCNLYKSSYKT